MSFLCLYYDDWMLLSRPIIVEGKLYLITVSAFHNGISIFNALIGEAVVFAGGGNLGAVCLLHHHSCDIDRVCFEFFDGGGGEEVEDEEE